MAAINDRDYPALLGLKDAEKKVDTLFFGSYEQDGNTENGKEPIEWIVLDVQGDKALLISRYGLDSESYNNQEGSITWEQCSLRRWLNKDFINAAFTAYEQKLIVSAK